MSVARVMHNKENPYLMVIKETILNPRLSYEALGFLLKCLSRPDDWEFKVDEMARSWGLTTKAVYKLLSELIEIGHAARVLRAKRNPDGTFSGTESDYIIFEKAMTPKEIEDILRRDKNNFIPLESKECIQTDTDFPVTDISVNGNLHFRPTDITNKEDVLSKERETEERERDQKEEGAPPPPSAPPLSPFYSNKNFNNSTNNSFYIDGNLILDKQIFEDLLMTYGKPVVRAKMRQLEEFRRIKPEKFAEYKCHASVLAQWLRRDKEEALEGQSVMPHRTALNDLGLINELLCYPDIAKHKQIDLGGDYVDFKHIRNGEGYLKAGSKGFKEKLESNLRKMNLPIPWLKKG